MRYWLKFGDPFAAQKNQICVTGENAAKFVARYSTEYQRTLSAEVWRRFCGQTYIIGEGAAKFCGLYTPSIRQRYRLKFGDAFAAQEYQMCLSVESAGVFWPITPSIKHALSAEARRRFLAKISSAMQVHVIGESAAKLMWPVTRSVKHALYIEVRRRFCGPKFLIPTMRYQCMA